jgi:hypothetical protein
MMCWGFQEGDFVRGRRPLEIPAADVSSHLVLPSFFPLALCLEQNMALLSGFHPGNKSGRSDPLLFSIYLPLVVYEQQWKTLSNILMPIITR